jgi:tetratricopeptide (TPR) repeat protein
MDMVKQGNRRALLLGALLLATAGLAAVTLWPWREAQATIEQRVITASRSPTLEAFMAQVVAASKIADPVTRCLRMPDPPDSHWHAQAVEAYCRNRYADLMDAARFRALIAAGKGAEVDGILDGYLQKQMHDPADAVLLDQAMFRAGFNDASEETRNAIDAWKRQRPDSAFAVAASGMQYHSAAFAARGADSASKTSAEQWRAARELGTLARHDLDRAATMTPAVPSIYSNMLSMAVLAGDNPYAMTAIRRGLEVQPSNLTLRLTQAAMTGTKWGGSTAWVKEQADDAAAAAGQTPLLWVAVGRAHIEAATEGHLSPPADGRFLAVADEVATGSDFGHLADQARRAHKYDDALILAVEALRFDNANGDALDTIGQAAFHGAYREWGKAELIRAAREHPESVDVAGNAGVWLRYLSEPSLAEPLMIYATEHEKDDWVLATLGDFYSHEGKNYTKAGSIADELIRRDPGNANGYVIRACVDKDTNSPNRYRSARDFLDRFGTDPDQQGPSSEIRAWLAAHPEPVAG